MLNNLKSLLNNTNVTNSVSMQDVNLVVKILTILKEYNQTDKKNVGRSMSPEGMNSAA